MNANETSRPEGRRIRLFAPELSERGLECGGEMALSAGETHHAVNVLRLRAGDAVELFDGAGRRASGKIQVAGKREVVVLAEAAVLSPPPSPSVHLAFAVPKGNRLDWLLEKATELAATSLQPVVFQRSVAGGELNDAKHQRWLGHCVSAAKQSHLDWLPEIRQPLPLERFLATAEYPRKILGDASPGASPLAEVLGCGGGPLCLLVGPEGGLSDTERQAVIAGGFVPGRIGCTVLRTETAVLAMLAAVRAGAAG